MTLRWKKDPYQTGLARVGAGPRGSTLRDGEEEYAWIVASRKNYMVQGWYWVARNDAAGVPIKNTYNEIVADEATAKANAMAYVKDCLKRAATPTSTTGD